ncbi:putative necrosis-inducing factor domain containing protein [Naviculisporaceae sp. PSN 640]
MSLRTILTGALVVGSLTGIAASPITGPAVVKIPEDEPVNNSTLATAEHEFYCQHYTYENHNSGGSPFIADCEQLARNIDRDGKWTSQDGPQTQLAQYKTCAFGVQPQDGHTSWTEYYTGNGDIITLITESIKRFGWEGKIGAAGKMDCRRQTTWFDGNDAPIYYGIYHT